MEQRLSLFDYQGYAADIMAGRDRYGLHDEMGIGKTATTIGAVNRILGERGMVIAPAMLRENWLKEFRRFSTYDLKVCKGQNIHDFVAWSRGRFDVLVTSYELATKWTRDYWKHGEYLDFIALDEAHYLKNANAQRTAAILGPEANGNGLVHYAAQAWHVTGTPMANDPMDAYTFLRFVKGVEMDARDFTAEFFNKAVGKFSIKHTVKPEMLTQLQALLGNNSIRRTHTDVGMELPPIFLTEMLLEGDTVELDGAIRDYPHLEHQIVEAIETGDFTILDAVHVAMLRRILGKAKAIPYAQLLKWELDSGAGKRVCFFCHTEPLEYVQRFLQRHGYGVVVAHGETPEQERQDAVRLFMESPDTHVFLGNIKVAGVGLTLTASSDIDIVESDWQPAANAQAIKRVHRFGQRQDVRARFITLSNTLDEQVNETVARKTAAIAEIEGFSMTAAPLDVLSKRQ